MHVGHHDKRFDFEPGREIDELQDMQNDRGGNDEISGG